MAKRVLWRSWSKLEAQFELDRLGGLPFHYQWVNAHHINPNHDDIWMTTNGYDHRPGPFKKASWTAESYQYLQGEYRNYQNGDMKWDHRFHFNPNYTKFPRTSHLNIMTWWKDEKKLFDETVNNKKAEFMFGMVLSKKPPKAHDYEFGWYRAEAVQKAQGRSFRYYGSGTGWNSNDPHYAGEAYVHGHRGSPAKFHDARILMSKAKFVFSFENIHDPVYSVNYMTEKIFHGFIAAAVPIYCGEWNIEQIISPDLFIDLRKFDMDITKAMDHCEKMSDSEYSGYLERIKAFLEGPGQKFTCEETFLSMDRRLKEVFG
jgi:hypothetical protein